MDNVESTLIDLSPAIQEVAGLKKWYTKNKKYNNQCSRLSSVASVTLAALVPFTAIFHTGGWRIIAAALGVAIAIIGGTAAAYNWSANWTDFAVAEAELEADLAAWHLAVAKAKLNSDTSAACASLVAAAELLVSQANEVRMRDTRSFFTTLQKRSRAASPQRGGTAEQSGT
jgi:hypothetical protein